MSVQRLKALTALQMREIDRRAIEELGIPALCLMENAGKAVADEAFRMLQARRRGLSRRNICIVCGSGNNGGDGLVAARHLLNKGAKVSVFLVGSVVAASPEFTVNYHIARRLKIPIFKPDTRGLGILRGAALIIDALFGVGLSRPVEGAYRTVIQATNDSGVPVLAVDVPSGLDATTGRMRGECVKASVTVTLAYPKKGLSVGAGPRCSGRVVVADIGIPYLLKPGSSAI